MRIALVTVGSRGDVQPIIALAAGLGRAGHAVRVVTHRTFESLAQAYGVELAGSDSGDPRELMQSAEVKATLHAGNPFTIWSRLTRLVESSAARFSADALRACEGADVIGFSGVGMFPGDSIAEKLGVPVFVAAPVPIWGTRRFPSPLFPPGLAAIPGYNRLTHRLADRIVWKAFQRVTNAVRRDVLLLPPYPPGGPSRRWARNGTPVLLGCSSAVVPRPDDWPDRVQATGYWFLDEPAGWAPPAALEAFLAAGPPPVCVGFGSMSTRRPERDARVVVEALARAGQRGILLSGWAELAHPDLPPSVIACESAPHAWLYPRCAAVVHHGGAGTTAAALRAGVPSFAVPFAFDQPFWGERIRALGCGPAAVPHRALSVRRLARAIASAVGTPAYRARARAVAAQIAAEDGPARAAVLLERWFQPSCVATRVG